MQIVLILIVLDNKQNFILDLGHNVQLLLRHSRVCITFIKSISIQPRIINLLLMLNNKQNVSFGFGSSGTKIYI